MAGEALMATVTGEPFQPVRLYYQVLDHKGLMMALTKLRCLDVDPPRGRWVWLYEHEAKSLCFQNSYKTLPPRLRPVVIGSLFTRTRDELLIDLRSCERAVLAIPFFDRHLSRTVARVTHAAVVNKLFPVAGNEGLTPDQIFDHQPITVVEPQEFVTAIKGTVANVRDPQVRQRIAVETWQAQSKRPLPPIERFPVHFYEEGIASFATALQMRQIVAMEHWMGHPTYSMYDVLQMMVKSS